jgi:hypothetical protein
LSAELSCRGIISVVGRSVNLFDTALASFFFV